MLRQLEKKVLRVWSHAHEKDLYTYAKIHICTVSRIVSAKCYANVCTSPYTGAAILCKIVVSHFLLKENGLSQRWTEIRLMWGRMKFAMHDVVKNSFDYHTYKQIYRWKEWRKKELYQNVKLTKNSGNSYATAKLKTIYVLYMSLYTWFCNIINLYDYELKNPKSIHTTCIHLSSCFIHDWPYIMHYIFIL